MLAALAVPRAIAAPPLSKSVRYTPSGHLYSIFDESGDRAMDFSNCGYRGGGVPLPPTNTIPVRIAISPVAGDNTAHIQSAINYVSGLPLDGNGFRGAVFLNAGEYPCSTSIVMSASGVVLRGAGNATNGTGTILRATGTNQYNLIRILGSGSRSTVGGTTRNITNAYVPVGARSFQVDSTTGLAVGDQVVVRRPSPTNWLEAIYAHLLNPPWVAGTKNLSFDRVITRIEGNWITVDAPLPNAIEAIYGGGTIFRYTWTGRIENCGVEDLYARSDYTSATDENHGWMLIEVRRTRNAWIRNVTSQYFGYGLVSLFDESKWITVQDTQCLDPISVVTGGRRYSYNINDVHLVLFTNCFARSGRHDFVWGSLTAGPNAFVDSTALQANSDSGGHYVYAAGMMFDNVKVSGHSITAENKGILAGGDSGWAAANCVYWNCEANNFRVQNPPTAQNWLIGPIGNIQTGTPSYAVGPTPNGIFDTLGVHVRPRSLYAVQLAERMSVTNLAYREYWIGDIDNFASGNPNGDAVAVDPAWQTEVSGATGLTPAGFDKVAANQVVPFTITFNLAPGEKVVSARLTLMLRSTAGNPADDQIFLESMAAGTSFASLGWLPLTATNAVTMEVAPGILQDGKLNVAVLNDVGVDWAMLDLRVAPAASASIAPAAPGVVAAYPENAQVFLSWSASLLADAYVVQRAAVSGGPYTTIATNGSTEFTDTTAAPGETSWYVVRGINAFGMSGPSMEVSAAPFDPSTGLLAWFNFNNGTAADATAFGHHGTLVGGATIVDDPVRGKVLALDGSTGKVDLGNPAGLNFSGEVTVMVWMKSRAMGGVNRNIVARGFGGSPSREFVLRTDASGNYDFGTWETSRGDQNATLPVPASDVGQNNWVHLTGTCTFDGANYTWRIYRNGVLAATSAQFPNGLLPMTVGWAIGARGGIAGVERQFDGFLDDIRIYNIPLNQAQIQSLMAVPPLVAGISHDGDLFRLNWTGGLPPYQVQTKTNLLEPVWRNLGAPISSNSLIIVPSEGESYFRIRGQ